MAVPATASGDDTPIVTATVYQGAHFSTDRVTVPELFADPTDCPLYDGGAITEDYGASGSPGTVVPPRNDQGSETGSWPMLSIVHCLEQTHVQNPTGVTVFRADGAAEAPLAPGELDAPGSAFADSNQAAVLFSLGSSFEYHRPQRTSSDANGKDAVQPANYTPIEIAVYTGRAVTVQVTQQSATEIQARGTVTYTATASGGTGLAYVWSSGDGQSATGPSVSFTYGAAGSYTAWVQVTSDQGGGGTADASQLTVTSPAAPTPTTTAGPSNPGPVKGATGPSPGQAPSHSHAPGRPKAGGKGHAAGHSTTPGNTRSGTRTGASATPSPTSTPSGPPSHGSSGSGGGSASSASGGTGHSKPATPDQTRRETPDRRLERVSGLLVSDVIPLSAATSPLVQETGAPPGSATAERVHVGSSSAPTIIAASLVVALLLALGAASELDVRWSALLPRVRG